MGDQKTLICVLPCVPLRAKPSDRSEQVSQIISGELVSLLEKCTENWIQISSLEDGYIGFADPRHFEEFSGSKEGRAIAYKSFEWDRGEARLTSPIGSFIYSDGGISSIGPFSFPTPDLGLKANSLSEAGMQFLGTPYHWGGRTKHGIDCSGLTQICGRLLGVDLQRNASMQAEQGVMVDWDNREVDDLTFFKNKEGKITHVGILLSRDKILHASGEVRVDRLSNEGIIHVDSGDKTHTFSHIRRLV